MQPGPYPPAAPLPATSDQMVRPAKSWFVVAALIAVVGIVIGAVILVAGIRGFLDRIDDFARADLPATLQVEIADTGGYSIYHEYDGASGDDGYAPDPDVTVTDPAGEPVVLDIYDSSVTYSAGGHEGEGVFTFHADEPGIYEVAATGEPGNGIAVGRGVGSGLVGAILGGLAIGLVAVVAGGILAIVVGVKRGRSRRALMPTPPFGGWVPPPPPVWGGPPGPPGGPGPGQGGYRGPGGYGAPPAPPPNPGGPARPSDGWSAPPPGGPASSLAVGLPDPQLSRSSKLTVAGAMPSATADPPSLLGPVDWARGDMPLPWSPSRR